MVSEPLILRSETLQSGIQGTAVLGPPYGPPDAILGVRVGWIAWDSGFRGSELQIGDLIVGVEGEPLAPLLQPGKLQTLIGQANESMRWSESGARPEQPLRLDVLRDDAAFTVTGRLLPQRVYRLPDGQHALAPGGPPRLVNDGFSGPWLSWYEKLVFKLSQILDRSWYLSRLNTRRELADLGEHQERIDFLLQRYSGEFANTVRADWEAAMECLRGTRLGEVDLGYRELGAQRLETVKGEAIAAYEAFRRELAPEMIPPFPAPPVERADQIEGKIVELPWITPRQIVNDLGQTYAVAESSDGYYLLQLSGSPEFVRFYTTMFRFRTQITPKLSERYQYVGRILQAPRMITYRDRAITGWMVQPIGIRAGESAELFADLRRTDIDGETPFAGEETVSRFDAPPISEDASPREVLEAMIRAVKLADEKAWRRLFAEWRVNIYDDGRVLYEAAARPRDSSFYSEWEKARKLIAGDVYDARVERVGPVVRLVNADPQAGLPDIDQVVAWVDHYGLFDGEYRRFNRSDVHRRWALQRIEGGPWRIAEVQGL